MLDADHLPWADEIVDGLYREGGFKPERPPSVRTLSIKLLKTLPRRAAILNEGELSCVNGIWRVKVRFDVPVEREPQILGHEAGHYWFDSRGEKPPPFIEALNDAIGARLAAPRVPFGHAIRHIGHHPHTLAKLFHTTQAVALLRIAELVGRSAAIDASSGRIVRGRPLDWPQDLWTLSRTMGHPIRVDGRWAMIANAA